jgi:FkbH-like protein
MQSKIRAYLQTGDYWRALEIILAVAPGDALELIQQAARFLDEIPDEVIATRAPLRKRLAVLGGATTQFMLPFVRLFALRRGVRLSLYESEFGLFEQEVWSNSPSLHEFAPDVIHFHTCSRNLAFQTGADAGERVENEAQRFLQLYRAATERFSCAVIGNNFETSAERPYASLDGILPAARNSMIRVLNSRLSSALPKQVFLHDVEALSAKHGKPRWFDPRLWHAAKSAVSFECQPFYADSLAAQIAALFGKSKKCLVVDLDNTLWGGVIGDDGLSGIQLNVGQPSGEAFQDFQRYLKSLKERGVLIAVASKNEMENAVAPFREHEGMILKESDVSCFIANWEPKDKNIVRIAKQLNIGLDAIVFFDDNPAERALVRAGLPEVAVLEVPEDPAFYVQCLDDANLFDTLSVTDEDRMRAEYFKNENIRAQLEHASTNYDDYLKQLGMQALVEPIHEGNLIRVTQLINKTNQFNLTTRRMTEAEVSRVSSDPHFYTSTTRLQDRFGDNGLISVIIGRIANDTLEIDTWLMSCRVLKRGVEILELERLLTFCRERSLKRVRGNYIPTAKNKLVENHYAGLGFHVGPSNGEGATWILDTDEETRQTHHIAIREGMTDARSSDRTAANYPRAV